MHLDHIQLAMPVDGEDAAREFFAGLLKMHEDEKPYPLSERGGVWFRMKGTIIHLGVEKNFVPQRKTHPAFLIDDFDTLAAILRAAGFPVNWDEALPHRRRFYSEDPFGNRLEFIHNGHGFTQI